MTPYKFNRLVLRSMAAMLAVSLALPAWIQAAEVTVGEAIHHDTSARLSNQSPLDAAGGGNKQVPIMEREVYGRFPDLAEPDGGLQSKLAPVQPFAPTPAPI